jgi:hypothetical protein
MLSPGSFLVLISVMIIVVTRGRTRWSLAFIFNHPCPGLGQPVQDKKTAKRPQYLTKKATLLKTPSKLALIPLPTFPQRYFQFARNGDDSKLKELLESMSTKEFDVAYPLPPCYWKDDTNPLHDAVAAGSLECVKLLAEKIEESERERNFASIGMFLSPMLTWCTTSLRQSTPLLKVRSLTE